MAFRNALVLLAIVLSAALVCAHSERERQERSLMNFVKAAGSRIQQAFSKVKDAVQSSLETVQRYGLKVEEVALNATTKLLDSMGIKVDVKAFVDLLKTNLWSCLKDDDVVSNFKEVKDSLLGCVSKEVAAINGVVSQMSSLWSTAEKLPSVMEDVSAECKAHLDNTDESDILENAIVTIDENHDLHLEAEATITEAKRSLSKRAAWNVERAVRCVQSVYSITQIDLKTIPSEIMTAAGKAFEIMQAASGASPNCLANNLQASVPTLLNIVKEFGTCTIDGMKQDVVKEISSQVAAIAQAAPQIAAAAAA